MDTWLITGVAGFIGSHLARRLLADGHRVVGMDNFCDFYDPAVKRERAAELAQHDMFEAHEADIRDRDATRRIFQAARPTRVAHIAAMAGVRPSIEDPALYTSVNLDGTVSVLDAALNAGTVKTFCFASSSSVYGNNQKVPFAEDDAVDHPISPYAATKRAGELICHTYSHLHGLPIACLRFFTVYGPEQRPDLAIAKFMRLISENKPIPMFGNGSMSRDFTFIDDIVEGIRQAAHRVGGLAADGSPVSPFRVWNLGGSRPVSVNELIEAIGEVADVNPQLEELPEQPGDVKRTWADTTRIERELGYRPLVGLHDGLRRQWEAWQAHKARSAR